MVKKIYILILNYNGKEDTLSCLTSLTKVKLPRNIKLTTLVVDNASTDDSVPVIKTKFPQVKILTHNQNSGFAQGNNLGIKQALAQGSDYVILLNNDTVVAPDFLNQLLPAVNRHPQGGIFCPKIYFAPGKEFHKDRYKPEDKGKIIWAAGGKIDWQNMYGINLGLDEVDRGQFEEEMQVEMASGCCMLLTKKLLEKITSFDERYFMYYEDVDLCLRAKQAEFEIWYIPLSKIWHVSAATSGIGSSLADYYISRNRLLVGMTYASWKTKYALIKESLRLLFTGRPWQRQGVLDFYLKRFGQGSFLQK